MGEGVGYTPLDDELTPIVPQLRVRVVVDCATVEAFIEEYHRFVQGDRIFIATDVLESPGNVVQFRIDLADGTALVHGSGTVLEARSRPHAGLPRGMLLRFVALDEPSARLIDRMTARQAMPAPARVVEIEAPPAGADELAPRWHTTSAQREAVLPANPFGDVPEAALAYFVDWAIERSGSTSWAAPGAVAFCSVRMRAPRRRRRALPRWAAFAAGVVLGGAAILAGDDAARALITLTRARVQPVAFAPPSALTTTTTTPPAPAAREPSPPARDLVFSTAAADAPRKTAELAIATEPGARVLVDGARVGHTPLVLHVAPGAHTVTLSRPRYATRDVAVQAPGRVTARLERPRATLHVSADAPGAVLFVDGESIGPTPISAVVAGYERADVEVRAPGCRAWHTRVYVKPPLTDLHAPPCASER